MNARNCGAPQAQQLGGNKAVINVINRLETVGPPILTIKQPNLRMFVKYMKEKKKKKGSWVDK